MRGNAPGSPDERWLAELQPRCLERGVFCPFDELNSALEEWIGLGAQPERHGELLGEERPDRLTADPPDDLTDQPPESQRVIAMPRAGLPHRSLPGERLGDRPAV